MNPSTYDDIVDEMSLAVTASIDYLKKEGDSQIIVRNGKLLSAQGEVFLYEFTSDKLQLIEEDANVEIKINNTSANGKVAAVTEGTVQIEADTNLGDSIAEARLIISSYFLLEQLNEKLTALRKGDIGHTNLAEKLFGLTTSQVSLDESYKFPASAHDLNKYQERAVRLSLGSEVTFIWGPPGTGKTFTIARLVEGLLSKNLSVLLISHTNAATDGALLDVVEHLKSTQDYLDGRLIREGKIVNKDLAQKRVTLEKIIEEKSKPILDEMREVDAKLAKNNNTITAHKAAHFMQEGLERLKNQEETQKKHLETINEQAMEISDYLKILDKQKLNVDDRIDEYQRLSTFKRAFKSTNLEKLASEKAGIRNEAEAGKAKIEELRTSYQTIKDRVADIHQQIKEQEKQSKEDGLLSDSEYEELENDNTRLANIRKALVKELEDLQDDLIANAKLIATTLTKSYQSRKVLSREYDCVIVDEASMAPLPALLTSAGLAKHKVILVGDFFQLPPIAKYVAAEDDEETELKKRAVDQWLRRDIFACTGITQAIKKGESPPQKMQQLRVQRRMHPDISEIVNKLVYAKYGDYSLENDSITSEYGVDNLGAQPLSNSHLGIYDTSGLGSLPSKTDSGSVYNVPQALICIELAKKALENGYEKIGIISAYRAQVNLLQKIIGDSLSQKEAAKVLADTVHKFQGGEKELIIFDVTTPYTMTMYDDGSKDGDDEKLINVAFSRAKAKLIIVGDVKKIERSHDVSSLIKQSIQHIRNTNKPIVDAVEFISPLELSDKTDNVLASLHGATLEEAVKNGGLLDENDFYKAFFQDLIFAEKEVIIISPWLSTRRYQELETILQNLRSRGVQIFVVTRPSDEHEGNLKDMSEKVIESMEKLGIVVLPIRGYTHQKVAIIDRKVLYVGSLNILSQRESHEIMHRIEGEKGLVAKQYMQFLKFDKNIGEIGKNNLRRCEVCTEPGAWYWTSKSLYGMWTGCLVGRHSPNKPPKPKVTKQERSQARVAKRSVINLDSEGIPICPQHNIKTVLKKGRPPYDDFYGCPKYKECDYAVSMKKVVKARAD